MKISIAMAVYNGSKYLNEQLQSFSAQTRLPDELIVCDDASTDNSYELLLDYQRVAPFEVIVTRNEANLNYIANFEKAIEKCRGDIILCSDQDDYWIPEKIKLIETIFQSCPSVSVVLNNMEICNEKLKPLGVTALGQIRSSGMNDEVLSYGCCTAFRSSLKEVILPLSDTCSHDVWINQFAKSTDTWYLHEDCLQLYRRHGANVSNWITSSQKPITRRDVKLNRAWTSYKARERILVAVMDRLGSRGAEFMKAHRISPKSTMLRLEQEIRANRHRADLMQKGALERKVLASKLFVSGGYKFFSGWRSFAKDLVI